MSEQSKFVELTDELISVLRDKANRDELDVHACAAGFAGMLFEMLQYEAGEDYALEMYLNVGESVFRAGVAYEEPNYIHEESETVH